jgi:hypothetical protein
MIYIASQYIKVWHVNVVCPVLPFVKVLAGDWDVDQ